MFMVIIPAGQHTALRLSRLQACWLSDALMQSSRWISSPPVPLTDCNRDAISLCVCACVCFCLLICTLSCLSSAHPSWMRALMMSLFPTTAARCSAVCSPCQQTHKHSTALKRCACDEAHSGAGQENIQHPSTETIPSGQILQFNHVVSFSGSASCQENSEIVV